MFHDVVSLIIVKNGLGYMIKRRMVLSSPQISLPKIAAIVIIIYSLCRALIFSNPMVTYLCILIAAGIVIYNKSLEITIYDLFFLIMLVSIVANKNREIGYGACTTYFVAWLCYYAIRKNNVQNTCLRIIAVFSVINIIFCFINIAMPNIYIQLVGRLIKRQIYDEFYTRFARGELLGLSDHYSRNAYFCVAGGTVFAAYFLSKAKRSFSVVALLFLEIAMIMVIGKRGHFLFLVASVCLVYILMQKGLQKKIKVILGLLIGLCIGLALVIELVPAARHIIDRTIEMKDADDISTGRFDLWKQCWEYFKQSPIIGQGFGFVTTHIKSGDDFFAGAHNDYLQWLCEHGIVGFFIRIIPSIGMYVLSIKEMNILSSKNPAIMTIMQKKENKTLIIWSVLFQTFVLLYSLTGLPHYDPEVNIIYYIALAVPISLLHDSGISNIWKIKNRRLTLG